MKLLLTVFSIVALVFIIIIIIASSGNISFTLGEDINNTVTNSKAPTVDSILLLLFTDHNSSIFSSLLQTISAQEEVNEQENRTDSDAAVKRGGEEEQDSGDSERRSSIAQEQEKNSSEEDVQKQDETKEDCRRGEYFDSEVDSCMPDQEKVCGYDRDNDSRVDSQDLDCLPNRNEQEQHDNKEEPHDKEKLSTGEEASLDNKESDKGGENPISMEQQNNNTSSNNNASSGSSDTEDKAQNSQNLTDSHTTTTTHNNASLNEFHYANDSAAEDGFTLMCHPAETKMLPGEEGSITCTIENKTPKPIAMVLECSGLNGTGIECYINGERPTETTLIKEMSYTNFSVLLVSRSLPPVSAGSYPFTISAEECMNSDVC
jgi:hypothetical protein